MVNHDLLFVGILAADLMSVSAKFIFISLPTFVIHIVCDTAIVVFIENVKVAVASFI